MMRATTQYDTLLLDVLHDYRRLVLVDAAPQPQPPAEEARSHNQQHIPNNLLNAAPSMAVPAGYIFTNISTTTSTTHIPTTPTMSVKTPSASLLVPLVVLLLVIPFLIIHTHRDYRGFLALGRGGTPHNFVGYLRIKLLSLVALRNPRAPAPIPAFLRQTGYLDPASLPPRRGPRPEVRGIAPHRQVSDQMGAEQGGGIIFDMMLRRLRAMAATPANGLVEDTSCFEKHGTGLFSTRPLIPTCRGEVCHIHSSEGSLHLTLYPADAKVVVEKGWGERHPLAQGGWLERFVPCGFLMVYAPRDEDEVEVVERIVKASVWWVSGVSIGGARVDDRATSEAYEKDVDVATKQEDRRDSVTRQEDGFCLDCRRRLDYRAIGS